MNSKTSIKLLSLICVLALVLSTPSMLLADDDDSEYENGSCKLQGTWIYDFGWGKWLITFNGTGDNEGTTDVEFIIADPYPDTCPGCRPTNMRGVWAKSGPHTYGSTDQSYFVDGSGAVLWIFLANHTITLTGCNTAEIDGEFKAFWPGYDEPFYEEDDEPGIMERLLLYQQSPVQ